MLKDGGPIIARVDREGSLGGSGLSLTFSFFARSWFHIVLGDDPTGKVESDPPHTRVPVTH